MQSANAQGSNLYDAWYLYQLETDLEVVFWDVEVVQPTILPYLIINNNLTFEGIGVCNSFSGTYTYDIEQEMLLPISFNSTETVCDTEDENSFEYSFFNQISANTTQSIALITENDYKELRLESYPGYVAVYRNVSLSIPDKALCQLTIFPNPVTNILNISNYDSESLSINIYDIKGKSVQNMELNSSSINVSELSNGFYFLEVISEKGKAIKKFIKK